MDALGGVLTKTPRFSIIVQKRNCGAQYRRRPARASVRADLFMSRVGGFTHFDRRTAAPIIKRAHAHARAIHAADRGSRAGHRVRGTSLAPSPAVVRRRVHDEVTKESAGEEE